jgi:drug/metabolite transporter (DMT)-like permease
MTSVPPASVSAPADIDVTGYALAIGGAVLFSTKGIFIKLAYAHGVPTETLLALRMGVALPLYALILAVILLRGADIRRQLRLRAVLATMGVGLLGYYVASYLDFLGLNFVSAQYERLVLFTYPFFVLILGALFFGERMIWSVVPAMAVSYAGIAVIFGWNLVTAPSGLWAGTALVLGSALTFALYQHLARRQMRAMRSMVFTCIGMSAAAVAALIQNALANGAGDLATLDGETLAYGLCLGILGTVLPSFMLNAGISRIGARATASTAALGPVVTAVIAVIVLGEAFTPFHAAGTALVIAGALLFGRAERRAKTAAAPP